MTTLKLAPYDCIFLSSQLWVVVKIFKVGKKWCLNRNFRNGFFWRTYLQNVKIRDKSISSGLVNPLPEVTSGEEDMHLSGGGDILYLEGKAGTVDSAIWKGAKGCKEGGVAEPMSKP